MDPNAGNPFTQGGNPYMQQTPESSTPVAGGKMDAGMAPVGDGTGGGTSETTKPRQMPGGAPANPPMGAPGAIGGGMPPMPGIGAPPTPPSAAGGDSNVPQDSPKAMAARKVREVRREILSANPEVPLDYAHHIAMSVVAFQHFVAASPMGPVTPQQVPQYSKQQHVTHPQQHNRFGGGYFGDLNDAHNPYSPLHPNHPLHRQYSGNAPTPNDAHEGDFVSQFGGRNPLEDHAYSKGYSGQNPHLYAAGDQVVNKALDWFRNRKQVSAPQPSQQDGPQGQPDIENIPQQAPQQQAPQHPQRPVPKKKAPQRAPKKKAPVPRPRTASRQSPTDIVFPIISLDD